MKIKQFIWIFVFLISLFSVNAYYQNQLGFESCDNSINWSISNSPSAKCQNGMGYFNVADTTRTGLHYIYKIANCSTNSQNISIRLVNYNITATNGGTALMLLTENATSGNPAKFIIQDQGSGNALFVHGNTGGSYGTLFALDNTEHNLTFTLWCTNNSFSVFVNNTEKARGQLDGPPQAAFPAQMQGNITAIVIGGYTGGAYHQQGVESAFDDFIYVNQSNFSEVLPIPGTPDTSPPSILFANMTSDGAGETINFSNPFCHGTIGTGCKLSATNDTTPTFSIVLNQTGNASVIDNNRDLNYSDIFRGSADNGNGTGQFIVVTLIAENASSIGVRNFSFGITSILGVQNLTGWEFSVNITDSNEGIVSINPNVTLYLNGTYANRSYEYNTTLINQTYGVMINITIQTGLNWSLDYDYMTNWTNGTGNKAIFINVSELNQTEFNYSRKVNISSGTFNVSIKLDNQTDLIIEKYFAGIP